MGDGGVVCLPLQHVMATISETFCGGGNGGGFNPKALKFTYSMLEKTMELEKEEFDLYKEEIVLEELRNGVVENGEAGSSSLRKMEKKKGLEREEFGLEKARKWELKKGILVLEKEQKGELVNSRKGEVENGEIVLDKQWKREIEKGEIVSERRRKGVEKDELFLEKWRKGGEFEKGEIEKGEIVLERLRKSELERDEIGSGRARKGETEKGEFVPEKWPRGQAEMSGLARGRKEVEKGEFFPDGEGEKGEISSERWRERESVKEEFNLGKGRTREKEKGEFVPEKGWKDDLECSPKKETCPSVKFSDDDFPQQKEYSKSGSDWRKRSSSWVTSNKRDSKSSSRTVDGELGSNKPEYSHMKNHVRENASGTRPKRDGIESKSSCRKNHRDFGYHSGSKSKRISDVSNHS